MILLLFLVVIIILLGGANVLAGIGIIPLLLIFILAAVLFGGLGRGRGWY